MVTLLTFSLRRNLQLEEGQVDNLLNEKASGWWGWLPWKPSHWGETYIWRVVRLVTCWMRRHMQGWDGYLSALTEEKPVVGGGSGQKPADWEDTFLQGGDGYLGNLLSEEKPAVGGGSG
jgi:hypothetical protein